MWLSISSIQSIQQPARQTITITWQSVNLEAIQPASNSASHTPANQLERASPSQPARASQPVCRFFCADHFGPNPYLTQRFWRNPYLTQPFCSPKSRFWRKSLPYSAIWAKSLPHSTLMNNKICFSDKPFLYSASSTNARTAVMTWARVVTNKNSLKIHENSQYHMDAPKALRAACVRAWNVQKFRPFIDAP